MKSVWQWTLLRPVIISKTIMQQNRVKSLHRNGDPLEQKRSSNILGRLRQSHAQLAQELKSITHIIIIIINTLGCKGTRWLFYICYH